MFFYATLSIFSIIVVLRIGQFGVLTYIYCRSCCFLIATVVFFQNRVLVLR